MIAVVWFDVLPVVAVEPSPQLIEYVHGASFTPGSLKVALNVTAVPVVAARFAGALTEGATLAIVAVVVAAELDKPSASVTVSET
ncbi:MAG TPA: hypothetical protein VEU74_11760, partial [Gemmatimonadales bacterium]|nr:hypothetical protein [Gemmatimonadales bacterium]